MLVNSCEDASVCFGLQTADFSSKGWGRSKVISRDKFLNEDNGYYTKEQDRMTLAGFVLVPLSSLKDDQSV